MSAQSPQVLGLSTILAMPGPLSEKLEAYRAAMRIEDPAYLLEYDRLVARLVSGGLVETAPKIGDLMVPFLLPDALGRFHRMEELLESGPLVLSFNRGHWCPFCTIELDALSSAATAIAALGSRVVSIMPDRGAYTRPLTRSLTDRFPILCDIDNGYALEVGLVIFVGDEVREIMLADGVDLDRIQGNGSWFMPFPATFVIGRDGRVVDRHIDPDFRTRMEVERILAALADLGEGPGAVP